MTTRHNMIKKDEEKLLAYAGRLYRVGPERYFEDEEPVNSETSRIRETTLETVKRRTPLVGTAKKEEAELYVLNWIDDYHWFGTKIELLRHLYVSERKKLNEDDKTHRIIAGKKQVLRVYFDDVIEELGEYGKKDSRHKLEELHLKVLMAKDTLELMRLMEEEFGMMYYDIGKEIGEVLDLKGKKK